MLKDNEELHDLLGYEGIKIIQGKEMFRFSLDSTLLANFVHITTKEKQIIDLCTGNAPIPLFLSLKTKAHIVGVELQEQIADMAKRSVEVNKLEQQIQIIIEDVKQIGDTVGKNTYDIVCANPPYFKYHPTSNINKNEQLTIARHEVKLTLEDLIKATKGLLKNKGHFYLVHRAERLQEICKSLAEYKLNVKRVQFIYPKQSTKEAMLVLIEAQKDSKALIQVLQPIYIHNEDGSYTEEILEIFRFKGTV